MAEDQLRRVIDEMRARLQAELETQLGSLAESHAQAIEQAGRAAEAEAEQRYAASLHAAREELSARLESEVAAARAETEGVRAEWSARLETEVAAARAETDAVRRELSGTFQSELAAARAEANAVRDEIIATFESEVATARAAVEGTRTEWSERLKTEVAAARAETEAVRHALSAAFQADLAAASAESEAIRTKLSSRLQTEVAAARAEVERTMVAESMRARVEAEQAVAETAAQIRHEMEQALAAERQRAQQQIDAARQQAQGHVETERQRAQRDLEHIRTELDVERARASDTLEKPRTGDTLEPPRRTSSSTNGEHALLDAIRAVDGAASLSDALVAVVRGAAREAPRAALFMINGAQLTEWPVPGMASIHAGPIRPEELEAGLLGQALRGMEPVLTGRGDGPSAPAFAALPAGRVAVAVPFVLGGTPVAVLYADEGAAGHAPASWPDNVQILGRHASAHLAYITVLRTAQALRLLAGPSTGPGAQNTHDAEQDEDQGARRYARLLVSEIKMYNESAVRLGRERRDLLRRLKPEIERARRLYDERVAASIRSRDAYFHQELVQTLADGDHSLLG
jgi:hypothetical protein